MCPLDKRSSGNEKKIHTDTCTLHAQPKTTYSLTKTNTRIHPRAIAQGWIGISFFLLCSLLVFFWMPFSTTQPSSWPQPTNVIIFLPQSPPPSLSSRAPICPGHIKMHKHTHACTHERTENNTGVKRNIGQRGFGLIEIERHRERKGKRKGQRDKRLLVWVPSFLRVSVREEKNVVFQGESKKKEKWKTKRPHRM